jgi:hypothetical protein
VRAARRLPPTLCRLLLGGLVLVLIVIAYFPFNWDPPRVVSNGVTRSAGGYLQFTHMNNARTPGTPAWLQEVRTSGVVHIRLVFEPRATNENAAIMMLAGNFWVSDFTIGQDGPGLLLWMRRPGTDANGDPPFYVGPVRPRQWNVVDVALQHGDLRVVVDGATRLAQQLPPGTAKVWGPGRISLGNEVHGGRAWQGKIRVAQVSTPGYAVNYVRPGALSVPGRYFYFPDHIIPFPGNARDWADFTADLLSFIPVGFLIVFSRRPLVPPVPAALLSAMLAVALAAGKFLFHGRHTALAMVIMEAVGGLLGALLAWHLPLARRIRQEEPEERARHGRASVAPEQRRNEAVPTP